MINGGEDLKQNFNFETEAIHAGQDPDQWYIE